MPLSPPPNRNGFALVVLFLLAVIVAADILSITSLGTNAPQTFQYVGPGRVTPPAPVVEVAPPPRPVPAPE